MEQGGNAIDAAIATALTLGVVDGYNSGIGGGCFVLIRTADGKITAIDGRAMAPAAAHADLFREAEKKQKNASTTGALASGVPGALAAYHQAVMRHGRLKFSKLIEPAAQIAEALLEQPDAVGGLTQLARALGVRRVLVGDALAALGVVFPDLRRSKVLAALLPARRPVVRVLRHALSLVQPRPRRRLR